MLNDDDDDDQLMYVYGQRRAIVGLGDVDSLENGYLEMSLAGTAKYATKCQTKGPFDQPKIHKCLVMGVDILDKLQ